MTHRNIYLERYAWPEQYFNTNENPDLIIVIPAYREPNLLETLDSINACKAPNGKVLILVVINESDRDSAETKQLHQDTLKALKKYQTIFSLHPLYLTLPTKKAGVGLARKIGMDEAVRLFEKNEKEGIIICCDADCKVDPNYLTAIESFYSNPNHLVGLVHHEHQLDGKHRKEIIRYELFLRYYVNALRYAGFPYAFQTLGSCICVRSSAYQKQGGMNTRKAGEDFYFIHKMVPLKKIGEINETTIYPSDRTSDRVPFGTGHAINKQLEGVKPNYLTYNPQSFEDLRLLFSNLNSLFEDKKISLNLPDAIKAFHEENDFHSSFEKIIKQSNNYPNFRNRFFAWWDGFRVLKFVHFARDHFYPQIELEKAIQWLDIVHLELSLKEDEAAQQLIKIRIADRAANFTINDTDL